MNLKAALLAASTAGAFLLVAACGGSSSDSNGSSSGGSGSTGGGSSGISGCQAPATGAYLVAPQLFVTGPGPITVTVQVATPSVVDIFLYGASAPNGPVAGTVSNPSLFNPVQPTAGMQAQQPTVTPFQPGADIAFAAGFRGPMSFMEPLSFTKLPALFPEGIPAEVALGGGLAANAGVIQTANGVLIGFTPPGTPAPSDFSGFSVVICVSDVGVH